MMRVAASVLQRCAKGGPDCQCAECRKKRVQRSAVAARDGAAYAPASVHAVLGSAGRPLEGPIRSAMEARLGHDFSRVRVHDDAAAARSAADVAAQAYTVGPHIAFGAGAYAPATEQGSRLLAHELAHVVQQDGASGAGPLRVMPANDPAERAADAHADAAMSQWSQGAARGYGVKPQQAVLQRKAVDDAFHLPCRDTRTHAFATVQAAELEAIRILRRASDTIQVRLALHPFEELLGESSALHEFRDMLWRRFHFDYNQLGIRTRMLPLIALRYRLVANWIARLPHRYRCAAAGVEPPGECTTRPGQGIAWTASGINETQLCESFWDDSATEQAGTILHEWFHFGFDWLGDCEARNRNNTVCYEMFARELTGTVTAADYATCCAPPTDPLPAFAGAAPAAPIFVPGTP